MGFTVMSHPRATSSPLCLHLSYLGHLFRTNPDKRVVPYASVHASHLARKYTYRWIIYCQQETACMKTTRLHPTWILFHHHFNSTYSQI